MIQREIMFVILFFKTDFKASHVGEEKERLSAFTLDYKNPVEMVEG